MDKFFKRRIRISTLKLLIQIICVAIVYTRLKQLFMFTFFSRNVEPYKIDLILLNTATEEAPQPINYNIKYILLWTPGVKPLDIVKRPGRSIFVQNNCKHFNCYITSNRSYFKDQTKFDAVLYNLRAIRKRFKPPLLRAQHQKYVLVSVDPAPLHPAHNPRLDNFFNWTWTYKLNSDIFWRSFVIHDIYGREVGPRVNMSWLKFNKFLPKNILKIMDEKTLPVVWINTECSTNSTAEKYVKILIEGGLTVDIYSECDNKNHFPCTNSSCHRFIKKYYFYLAPESVFDIDYVTDNLLLGLQNYAVPIVFGGANYSRFLPPGSYLNANLLNAKKVIEKIQQSLYNLNEYMDYFKWTSYYMYKPGREIEICQICTALNNEKMMNNISIHRHFRVWWNGELMQKIFEGLLSVFREDEDLQTIAYKWGVYKKNYSVIFKYFYDRYLKDESKINGFLTLMKFYTMNSRNATNPLHGENGLTEENKNITIISFNR